MVKHQLLEIVKDIPEDISLTNIFRTYILEPLYEIYRIYIWKINTYFKEHLWTTTSENLQCFILS